MGEHWTLLEDEQALVSGERGTARLGFAVLLKFSTQYGRLPWNHAELPSKAAEFVARQASAGRSAVSGSADEGRAGFHHSLDCVGRVKQ